VPILAEREHVAQRARLCAVGSRGPAPVTLEERVAERLRGRGVERAEVDWDSARDEDGVWHLTMTFAAGGRRRTATWQYEPLAGSVTAVDDEARWLSEESSPGVIPTPHHAGASEGVDVYDVDADGGIERAAQARAREPHEPIDLMAAMREHSTRGRRGRRRPSPAHTPGDDLPREDALPIEELAVDPGRLPPPPPARGERAGEESAAGGAGDGTRDDADDEPGHRPRHADDSGARRPPPNRKGRPSVPSWDDIVFGTKGSGPA
jgi:hypothetical protein